jgi:hypothetical protein
MFLNQCIFAVEGNGVEIKIEGISPLKAQFVGGIKPELQKLRIAGGVYPATVFGKKGAFGDSVEPGKKGKTFVEYIAHGMTVASIAEELQGKKGSYGMPGRDHLGAGQSCLLKQLVEWYPDKEGQKKIQAPETRAQLF